MSAADIKAGRAYVEIGGDESKLIAALNRGAKKMQQWGGAVRGIGLQIAGAGAAIFAPLAGAATAYAEHGDALKASSQKTGLTVEALSTLGYAAKQSRVDIGALEGGVTRMNKTLAQAAEGSSEAEEALGKAKTTVAELNNLSQEDRLKRIADGLKSIKDPAARAAATMGIFGKSGAELLPLLEEGSQGITQMQERAKALGLQWSTEDAEAADAFRDSVDELWGVLRRGTEVIGSAVAPVMQQFVSIFTNAAVVAMSWAKQHKTVIATAFAVGGALLVAGTSLVVFATVLSSAGIVLGTVASAMGLVVSIATAMLSPIGLVTAAVFGGAAALLYFSGTGAAVGNGIIGAFKQIYEMIKFVFSNTSTLSEAWGAAQTEAGIYIMQAWAQVKGNLVGLWIGFKGFMNNLWDGIGISIVQGAYNASESFLKIWDKAMHAWSSIVNATARKIQDTFLATDKSEMDADLARIDRDEQSGKLTTEQANQQRVTSHATYSGLEDRLYADREKQNDDDLNRKLAAIKAEADARKATLDDLRAKQKQATDAQTAEETAANDKSVADAVAAAKAAREAYEAELKKLHDGSGQSSLADQLNSFLSPLSGAKGSKLPTPDDVAASITDAKGPTSAGAFSIQNSAQAHEIFGGGNDNAATETANNTKKVADLQQEIVGWVMRTTKAVERWAGFRTT